MIRRGKNFKIIIGVEVKKMDRVVRSSQFCLRKSILLVPPSLSQPGGAIGIPYMDKG